jgi:hypothetical protein
MSDVKMRIKVRIEVRVEVREGAEVYQMKMKGKKEWERMVLAGLPIDFPCLQYLLHSHPPRPPIERCSSPEHVGIPSEFADRMVSVDYPQTFRGKEFYPAFLKGKYPFYG